jgi:putative transposase
MRLENGSIRHLRHSFNDPGHAHELTFCCYHGYKLLSTDRAREWFVDALDRARRIHHFLLIAYVIMPEHAHLLTLPEAWEYETSRFLKSVKKGVSQRAMSLLRKEERSDWLERLTHRYPGGKVERRFWQPGGGYDRNIVTQKALLSSIRYIHANPVRRGLVQNPLDWEWSSARWWEGDRDVKLAMDAISLG